jgi:hypothetical protein
MQHDPIADALLEGITLEGDWRKLASDVTDKEYRKLVAYDNCTSYSQLQELHACPRRYQLIKAQAKEPGIIGFAEQGNIDFAFGHSVGAGVGTLAATGDLTKALFAGFVSWKADYFADLDTEKAKFTKKPGQKKNKNIGFAQLAIEKFAVAEYFAEWEVYTLPNGRPAVEVAFEFNTENGFKHYGHIDLLMRHRVSRKVAVWEFKTNGSSEPDEAMYANSSQALGYGVILDSLEPDLSEYDVIYAVYSSPSMEWHIMPFAKSLTQKAEGIQDILLDHNAISTYRKMDFFPKRGESCRQFNRRCQFFGTCDLTTHVSYRDLPETDLAESVDFQVSLSDVIKHQRSKQT